MTHVKRKGFNVMCRVQSLGIFRPHTTHTGVIVSWV